MSHSKKIIVLRLSALGDIIRSFGMMQAIRKKHPDAHITWLTTAPFANLLTASGYFDDVWAIERWRWHQPHKWLSFARKIRKSEFDIVYDLQRNDRTDFMRRLCPPALRANWYGRNKPLKDDVLDTRDIRGAALPDMGWLKGDIARYKLPARFALLVAGCAPQHIHKRWPPEKYAVMAQHLLDQGIVPVALGTASEAEIISAIKSHVPSLIDLSGQTALGDIAELARHAVGAIGNDTGPMHIISLTNCPTISLFGGRYSIAQCGPLGGNVTVIQKDNIEDISTEEVWTVFERVKRG